MSAAIATNQRPFLSVRDLRVEFAARQSWFRRRAPTRAVNDVSFSIPPGQTLGLVGESGAGKSTVARAILRLTQIQGGEIFVDGRNVSALSGAPLVEYRRQVQVVFQDPYSSLNPSHIVGEIVGELITRHRDVRPGPARDKMAADLLQRVGLGSFVMARLPDELSGGQRQRVAIARALAVEPRLIVCDEPTSALDVSIQSQIVNLLADLQANAGLTYLFITHNLAMARHISHNLAVMYLGYLVESGPTERVFAHPAHPYTEMLLAASPVPDPAQQRERAASRRRLNRSPDPSASFREAGLRAQGTGIRLIPDPRILSHGTGCPFANRCPLVMDVCRRTMPAQTQVSGGGNVRCHARTTGTTLGGSSVGM